VETLYTAVVMVTDDLFQELFDVTDQVKMKKCFDFLYWLVKTDVTLFLLATSKCLHHSK